MNKTFVLFGTLFLLLASNALAQRGTADVTISGKKIEIEYGRPSLQGRDMLGKLPVGGTWRMGMNEATTLKTDATLVFGDKAVSPGEYRLTAKRVAEDSWHLIFGSDSGNVEVPLQHGKAGEPVETFTIQLDSRGSDEGSFSMAWGTLMVGTGFKVK